MVDETWAAHTEVAGFTPLGSAVRRSRSGPTVAARRDSGPGLYGVKWLVPSIVTRPELVLRLRSDIGRLNGMGHAGVAEMDKVHETAEGIVVGGELVEAVPIRDLLRDSTFSDTELALVAIDVLDALAWIHHAGVLHRDVTPDTILVDSSGQLKLVDVGIAAPAYVNADAAGTPAYMAPEIWRGADATAQSDLYALACTLFELALGEPPFGTKRVAALRSHHLNVRPDVDRLPESVRGPIAAGLAKDQRDRIASAALWREKLIRHTDQLWGEGWRADARRRLAARALSASFLMPSARLSGMAQSVSLQRPHNQGRWRLVAAGVGLLAACGLISMVGYSMVSAGGHARASRAPVTIAPPPDATEAPKLFATQAAASPTPSPSATPSPSPSPTATSTPHPSPSSITIATVTPTPATPTPTQTSSPTPTATVSPTPTLYANCGSTS